MKKLKAKKFSLYENQNTKTQKHKNNINKDNSLTLDVIFVQTYNKIYQKYFILMKIIIKNKR